MSTRPALSLSLLLVMPFAASVFAADLGTRSDAEVARAVRARLAAPDATESRALFFDDVGVVNGVAQLHGTVLNRYALAAAVRVVREVPGVRAVDAHAVRVEPNP